MTTKPYHEPEYWRDHYAAEDPERTFDWYNGYEGGVQETIEREVQKDGRVLTLGCGNSLMGEGMHAAGYSQVVNTDIAENVVERMRRRAADKDGLTYEVQDARSLAFADQSFNAVIDKGLIDALDMGPTNVPEVCLEVSRVLAPGGKFLVFTVDPPFIRQMYFDQPQYGWQIQHSQFANPLGVTCHAFVMTKG